MQSPNTEELARIQSAMVEIGMLAVTDFRVASDTDADAFGGPLAVYSRCVHEGLLDVHEVDLGDATTRATLATTTNHGKAQPLTAENCPDLGRKAGDLRLTIDRVGKAYARLLDGLVHGTNEEGELASSGADSFVEATHR